LTSTSHSSGFHNRTIRFAVAISIAAHHGGIRPSAVLATHPAQVTFLAFSMSLDNTKAPYRSKKSINSM
jgi:hypothetical protein